METKIIKEINKHISDALKQWSEIALTADADKWAYYLDYNDEDLLNVLFLFNHVWCNRAIKTNQFDENSAKAKITEFSKAIEKCFGINTIKLTEKVLSGKKEENYGNKID